jgi:hypothetical protein
LVGFSEPERVLLAGAAELIFGYLGCVVGDPWSWVEAVEANRFDTDVAD